MCPRTSAVGARNGNVLPTGAVVREPQKLSVEDNRAAVSYRVASYSRDGAAVDAAANGFIFLLLVAKLEFDRGARPHSVGALHECPSRGDIDYRHVVSRADPCRHDPMFR